MCLLALLFRCRDDAPVIVGANREEAYDRGGTVPQRVAGPLRFVAGLDPIAGGTWLGVNERGLLIAVTNRPRRRPPERPRSRGLLARDLLGRAGAGAAADAAAAELATGRYAGCNLLCVDADAAFVLHAGDELERRPLQAGVHVLTAHDINDRRDPRLAYARERLRDRHLTSAETSVRELQSLCAEGGNGSPPMVLRGATGGTVSSSVVALAPDPAHGIYLHAQGPPDATPYVDYSALLRQLAEAPGG
jgi:uncharacterized protein with NRDE domain